MVTSYTIRLNVIFKILYWDMVDLRCISLRYSKVIQFYVYIY